MPLDLAGYLHNMAPGSDPQHKHFPPPPLPKRRTQDEAFIKDPQRKHLPLPPLPKRRNQDEVFIKEQPSKASPQPLSTASSRRLPLSSLPLTRRVSANVSEVDSLGHPIKLSTTKPPFKNDRSADFLIDRQAGCVDLGLIEPETYPKLDQPVSRKYADLSDLLTSYRI